MRMDQQGNYNFTLIFVFVFVSFLLSNSAEAYKNYTVGDSLGWYDNQIKPKADYQKWADGKSFGLGDFLIFNTDNNHSVVQTNNFTTYKLCDAQEEDTYQWSTTNPSNTATEEVTVAVPLLKEGTTYFFSGDYDGDQCKNGQSFKINVTHGQGLPNSLKSPSEQAPAPNSADYNNDESAPDIVVPSNFNNPRPVKSDGDDDDDDHDGDGDKKKESGSDFLLVDKKLNVVLVLLGIICIL